MRADLKQKCLREVEFALLELPETCKSRWDLSHYVGADTSALKFMNLQIPALRKRLAQGFTFSHTSESQHFEIWDYIFCQSNYFECLAAALMFLENLNDRGFSQRTRVIAWSKRIDNWAHADSLCSFLSSYRERAPIEIDAVFSDWEESDNPWHVRLSLVGIYFYSRMRTHLPSSDQVLARVTKHLRHKHPYVQKALGWTIRENYNVYPRETLDYLQKHAQRIPSAAWHAATEKLDRATKGALLKLRKMKICSALSQK